MKKKTLRATALLALWLGTLPATAQQSGDLLFVRSQTSAFEKAIGASTGEYTHVAIVERDAEGRIWVIEATTGTGVDRVSLETWKASQKGIFDRYSLIVPFDTADVIARAKAFLGQPYDDAFLPGNGRIYCSELVYEAYRGQDTASHLFEAQPMNFRDNRGRLPLYWKRHFRRLGIPVPEGVPGTNPTSLARSPLLRMAGQ